MSSDQQKYGDPQTRKRILDVALTLAAEMGPTMRLVDVSSGAGVSHQGLYLHFGGRDGLLVALLAHMVETFDLHQRHSLVVDASDGATALRRMVEFLGSMNQRLDSIGWVLEEAQFLDDAFGRDWRQRVAGLRAAIESEVISRLAHEGSLREGWEVSDAADLFIAVTTLGTWRDMTRELGWTPEQYIENVTRLLSQSLIDS
jgi:AcrR family transcriptional regulator